LIVITYVAAAIGSSTAHSLLSRFRAWAPLSWGVILFAVSLFGFSVTRSFYLMPVFGAILGYFFGSSGSIVNGYVAKHYSGMFMNLLHCCYSFGCAIGPAILSYFIINMDSWRMGYQVVGIIEIGSFAIVLATYSLWREYGEVVPRRKKSLVKVPDEDIVLPEVKVKSNRELIRLPSGRIIPIIMFFYAALEVSFLLWAASYLTEERGMTPGVAAGMMAVFFAAQIGGRLLSGFLSLKIPDRKIIRVMIIIVIIGMVLLNFAPLNILVPLFIVLGLSTGPCFPLLVHEVPAIVGVEDAQGIIGLQLTGANLGTAIVPVVLGVVSNYAGFKVFPVFMIVLVGMTFVLKTVQDQKIIKI
jgi:fucose permease